MAWPDSWNDSATESPHLLDQDCVLIWELKAADGAGAVIEEPFSNTAGAKGVLAGQHQDLAAFSEVLQADLALLQCLLLPCCVLHLSKPLVDRDSARKKCLLRYQTSR